MTSRKRGKKMPRGIAIMEIPADKEATAARLQRAKDSGWQELEDMSRAQLADFEQMAASARVMGNALSPHNQLVSDALAAIRDERIKRDRQDFITFQQRGRRQEFRSLAVDAVRDAIEKAGAAYNMDSGDYTPGQDIPVALPPVDACAMSDGEIADRLATLEGQLMIYGKDIDNGAEQLAKLQTPAAQALAEELGIEAKARADYRESLERNANALREERVKRESERAAQEAERAVFMKNLPESVADLIERVTALEGKK